MQCIPRPRCYDTLQWLYGGSGLAEGASAIIPSGPIPKFATTRGTFRCELRNLRTSNSMISSAVLNLKFLNELAASYDRNFKFTALVRGADTGR
jgi:hypothetical protein